MLGRLAKLKIIAYKDVKMNNAAGDIAQVGAGVFFAQVNPEQYTVNYTASYRREQEPGTKGMNPEHQYNQPKEMTFEFLFDSTGAIPDTNFPAEDKLPFEVGEDVQAAANIAGDVAGQVLSRVGVMSQIEYFENTVFSIQGETHTPNFLVINWGAMVFKCRLRTMSISYKMFSPEGFPIRATVNATFQEVAEQKFMEMEAGLQSPDITHQVTVEAGDTLPMLAKRVYGDEKYYVAVARANNLVHFRELTPGRRLYFPPIKRQ